MRKLKWLFSAVALLGIAFAAWQGFKPHKKHYRVVVTEEKPFVIIIPSYNNSAVVEKNLRSVFDQKYSNYRVIYIDDCSTDDTLAKVEKLVKESGLADRVRILHNEKNRGAVANFYYAIHSCKDNEIVVAVDGDDFLAHDGVLTKLNRVYADSNVWMTYGNYLDYPSYKQEVISCKKIPESVVHNNRFRKEDWVSSHLRTFYAGLFKQIKLQDLLLDGHFYPMAGDLAMLFPLLEMAGSHSAFIPDILYLYNRSNPLNDHKINFSLQEKCAQIIRKSSPYSPLAQLKQHERAANADLVIFSYNRPMQLYALLESTAQFVTGLQQISVIYRADGETFARGYEKVSEAFGSVRFIRQLNPPKDFSTLLFETAFAAESAPYILFAVDDILIKDPIDLRECARSLEKTGAYGFYLAHGLHLTTCFMQDRPQAIPPHLSIDREIFAWQFKTGQADWNYPNSLDMVLYRKTDVEKDLRALTFHTPNTLEEAWAKISKKKQVGLFYTRSRSLNIPLNLVNLSSNRHLHSYTTEELQQKFEAGLKIDLTPFLHIENPSKHHAAEISFVKRQSLN